MMNIIKDYIIKGCINFCVFADNVIYKMDYINSDEYDGKWRLLRTKKFEAWVERENNAYRDVVAQKRRSKFKVID